MYSWVAIRLTLYCLIHLKIVKRLDLKCSNLCAEYIIRSAGLDEAQAGI